MSDNPYNSIQEIADGWTLDYNIPPYSHIAGKKTLAFSHTYMPMWGYTSSFIGGGIRVRVFLPKNSYERIVGYYPQWYRDIETVCIDFIVQPEDIEEWLYHNLNRVVMEYLFTARV